MERDNSMLDGRFSRVTSYTDTRQDVGKEKIVGEGSIGVRHKWAPAIYTTYFGMLNEAANKLGYALTIHGSMSRDFDLVAIPWIADCGSHEDWCSWKR